MHLVSCPERKLLTTKHDTNQQQHGVPARIASGVNTHGSNARFPLQQLVRNWSGSCSLWESKPFEEGAILTLYIESSCCKAGSRVLASICSSTEGAASTPLCCSRPSTDSGDSAPLARFEGCSKSLRVSSGCRFNGCSLVAMLQLLLMRSVTDLQANDDQTFSSLFNSVLTHAISRSFAPGWLSSTCYWE